MPVQHPPHVSAGVCPEPAGKRGISIPSATFSRADRLAALAAAVKPVGRKSGVFHRAPVHDRPEGGFAPSKMPVNRSIGGWLGQHPPMFVTTPYSA
jgi:hypothetical protein